MNTQQWHVEARDLEAYQQGRIGGLSADSIEAHLLQCTQCRSVMAVHASTADRDRRWARIADVIDRPSRQSRHAAWLRIALGTPERILSAVLLLIVVIAVPAFIVLGNVRAGTTWFLALAPAFSAIGAVLAYRFASDPAGEISSATPLHSFRIVAMRALVVLAAVLPIGIVISVLLPERATLVLGWVLPGIAFCALVLAAGTRFEPTWLGGALAIGWAAAVVGGMHRRRGLPVNEALEQLVINRPVMQGLFAALALLATIVFMIRRDNVTYSRSR